MVFQSEQHRQNGHAYVARYRRLAAGGVGQPGTSSIRHVAYKGVLADFSIGYSRAHNVL